jgi:peptidoglycan/xylan/chitin deacetylase (PgdA/CDA1 family)
VRPSQLTRRELAALGGAAALLAACDSRMSGPHVANTRSAAPTVGTAAPPSPTRSSDAAAVTLAAGTVTNRGGDIVHGPRTRPRIALTFHGAGTPTITAEVLGLLASHHAKATIFAVGTWLEQDPKLAQDIVTAGHELGNHTLHHFAMRSLGAAEAIAEVAGCAEILHKLTGSSQRWFRPSGTPTSTPVIRAAARRFGYLNCVSYDVDSLDYTDPGASVVTSNVLGNAKAGSIVSMHLGHIGTVNALPAVLAGLAAHALRPVTLSDLVG